MWIGNYQHRPFGEESKYLNLFYTHHRLYSYTMTPDKYTWILENPNLNIGNRESYAPNLYEGYESGNQTELWMDYTQGLRGFQQ